MFGIFYRLRKGEFLPKSVVTNCHHTPMQRCHLHFIDANDNVIPNALAGIVRATWLFITIEFSKSDRTRGRVNRIQTVIGRLCELRRRAQCQEFWAGGQKFPFKNVEQPIRSPLVLRKTMRKPTIVTLHGTGNGAPSGTGFLRGRDPIKGTLRRPSVSVS